MRLPAELGAALAAAALRIAALRDEDGAADHAAAGKFKRTKAVVVATMLINTAPNNAPESTKT